MTIERRFFMGKNYGTMEKSYGTNVIRQFATLSKTI